MLSFEGREVGVEVTTGRYRGQDREVRRVLVADKLGFHGLENDVLIVGFHDGLLDR